MPLAMQGFVVRRNPPPCDRMDGAKVVVLYHVSSSQVELLNKLARSALAVMYVHRECKTNREHFRSLAQSQKFSNRSDQLSDSGVVPTPLP